MFETLILCTSILSAFPIPNTLDPADAHDECRAVANAAVDAGVPPALAVALGYHESKFDRTATPGPYVEAAKGSLQVLPQWHCPGYRSCRRTAGVQQCKDRIAECDLIAVGIKALTRYLSRAFLGAPQHHRRNECRADKRLDALPRPVVWHGLCGYTGCKVDKGPDRPPVYRRAYVNSILRRAQWLQASVDCACSAPLPPRTNRLISSVGSGKMNGWGPPPASIGSRMDPGDSRTEPAIEAARQQTRAPRDG